MELSNSNIKKFLIFSQKKAFLIFRETETPKKLFIYKKIKPLLNCFLYFGKWNFLALSFKKFLYFRKELIGPANKKFLIFLFTFFEKTFQ